MAEIITGYKATDKDMGATVGPQTLANAADKLVNDGRVIVVGGAK